MPVDPATYADLIVNEGGDPTPQTMIDPPRRARVTTRTYGGDHVTLELDVVARSGAWLCVAQPRDGRPDWLAWVAASDCAPIKA